jgi:hypothetical protein
MEGPFDRKRSGEVFEEAFPLVVLFSSSLEMSGAPSRHGE